MRLSLRWEIVPKDMRKPNRSGNCGPHMPMKDKTGSVDFEFDEYAYLENHPDVLASVRKGLFASGRQHFERFGHKEGRRCHAIISEAPRVFVVGAYGTRNVGDEAIFEGARRIHANAIQLYINAPRKFPAVEMYSMLRDGNKFSAGDTLVIGGGGLLYDAGAIGILVDLARRARSAGAAVRVERIGCEAARPEYHDVIAGLFRLADSVTVRSSISQQIVRDICGMDVERQEDFALELAGELPPRPERSAGVPRIGLVTGGDHMEEIGPLMNLVREFTSDRAPTPVRFVHIPHSVSHVDFRNNDEVVGAKIASGINGFLEGRHLAFSRQPFTDEPLEVLRTYAGLDGLITRRFHGLVFAHMMQLPVLGLPGDGAKNTSFIEDHPREDQLAIEAMPQIGEGFAALMRRLQA